MPGFLRNLSLDRLSFWIGFLTGILFWWFLGRMRPILRQAWIGLVASVRAARAGLVAGVELRHRNDTLRLAQRMHLAAPLFSLDEILIEPRLLAPLPDIEPEQDDSRVEESHPDLPYLLDWPELAARYQAKTLTLAEALSGGANLLLVGNPGSGKTVALACCACQVARRDANYRDLVQSIPILVHIADLLPSDQFTGTPLELIHNAVAKNASALALPRLTELLTRSFENGQVLCLIDGMDEASPAQLSEGGKLLASLLNEYPRTRLIVAANPSDLAGLTGLGLIPLAIVPWGQAHKEQFVQKWGACWRQFVPDNPTSRPPIVDPFILDSWLVGDDAIYSPLEFVLRVWSAYAGDVLGSSARHSLEAYLRRMTVNLPKSRPALESLALQMIATCHPILSQREAGKWVGDEPTSDASSSDLPSPESQSHAESASPPDTVPPTRSGSHRAARLPGMLPDLLDMGILVEHLDGRISFAHPTICSYLAACSLAGSGSQNMMQNYPEWFGKTDTASWLSALQDISPLTNQYLSESDDTVMRHPLTAARWLRYSSKTAPWRSSVLRFLATTLQSESMAVGLRARALVAMVLSGETGVSVLLRQLLISPSGSVRYLAALGLGFFSDPQSIHELAAHLDDPEPDVQWAAAQALVATGQVIALESLASAMLQASEVGRRFAAQALAKHPIEGHPVLQEASEHQDLLVRRAAVAGLSQISQPWTKQALERIAVEDKEWVVRAAATQALEDLDRTDARIPKPFPPLSETPWLIAFAGERGVGIAPGKPTENLLLTALVEGSPTQVVAALGLIGQFGISEALPVLDRLMMQDQGVVREAAFQALWLMDASRALAMNPITTPEVTPG